MGRPPLPLGTGGKVRFNRSGTGWSARCSFRDYDGVTRDVERSRQSKAAAERALKEALRDRVLFARGAEINAESKLCGVVEAWWTAYVSQDGSLGSKTMYRWVVDHQVLPAVGSIRCREFSVAVAELLLRRVEQRHGRALAKTVRTVLSNICAFAARLGVMTHNPVRDTSPIRTKPRSARLRTSLGVAGFRQLHAYLSYLPTAVRRDVPAVIDFMAATGERLGECLAVTGEALNLEERTVEVRGTVARYRGIGVVLSRKPKTEAGYRTLTLPDWVMPVVASHVENAVAVTARVVRISDSCELVMPEVRSKAGRSRSQPPGWLRNLLSRGVWWEETITIVFPSAARTLRDPSNVSREVKAALVFAGLGRESSHLLRRTVATQMDDAGVPAREIADQLGHSRVSMTQDAMPFS